MGGVAPRTTPVRAHQASLGTICAASWRVGAGSLVLRGPHGGRRLGRGGGSRSGSSLGRGGTIPPASGGGGRGPSGPRAGGGAGGSGGVARRPPCSPSGRRPAVLNPGPLRVAGALPSGVCMRSGPKCCPGVGGVRGGPQTAPPGALADLNPPSALSEWAVVTRGSCGARPPYCSVVRVAPARQCGLAGAGPAAAPPTASPPRLQGGGGPRPWLPSWGGCGGGRGECGGPSGPLAMPPDGRGGGAAWQSWPRGPAISWGVAPFPRPPLPRVRSSCRPSLGPLIPPAVFARRWQAGGGREG